MGAFKKLKMSNGSVKCLCGSFIKCNSMKKHETSKKHLKYIEYSDKNYDLSGEMFTIKKYHVICAKCKTEYDLDDEISYCIFIDNKNVCTCCKNKELQLKITL